MLSIHFPFVEWHTYVFCTNVQSSGKFQLWNFRLLNVKIQFAMSNDLLYDDANLRNVCDKNNNAEHNSDTIARRQIKYYFPKSRYAYLAQKCF